MKKFKRVLFYVPYPIGPMDSAPKVRAYNLYKELNLICDVVLISGSLTGFLSAIYPNRTKLSKFKISNRLFDGIKCYLDGEFVNSIDYVYIEGLASPLFIHDYNVFNLFKKKKIPIFTFIRDLYWKYPDTLKKTIIRRFWYNRCENELQWYLKNASGMLFPSPDMAETLNFENKFLLPPGGDPSQCIDRQLPMNKNITYIGGISNKMGIDILSNAMNIVVKEYPDAHCTIIGRGDNEIVHKYCRKPFITYVSNVSYFDVPKVLSNTDITAIPIPNIPHNRFALPVKLFDYMSSNRPIVATNCPSMTHLIEKEKIGLITKDNPKSFAEGIIFLLDNPDLAQKYGDNAYKSVIARNSWRARANRLLNIMENYSKSC
ncbi:glycosyltransferase family 4 protein [Methanospirillum sp.]|jgi:glycosyltransferase involved in cell wall biosynthesis|uniref:glycosyltransferase family 4 protein n=1 Tax=Methanospirillum sp. TaxID=45200 RepID=UPI001BD5C48E|nr:glycosyltransferase family 4 protein [Methanospirillum sp.]